jgi:tetratricopeptide (TPR) repeat protein
LEQIEMLIHRQAGNREELINSFKRAIERDPSRANIYGQMVESLMEMNRTEEALGFLSQAMEKVPENQKGTIREMRIIAHRALKDYDSAIAVTREAIENEPENWRLGLLLVSLYRQSERPEEMGAALDALLEKHKSNPMVQYQLAMTFWEKKDYPQVETALRAALDLDPDFVEALNSLGYLFAERNANLEEALELVQKALKLKPNAPHILDSMGWVYHQMGQYEKAVDFLEKASNNGEPDPVTLEHLGSAYQNLGRTKDALKTFRLALDKAKDEQKENIEERIRKLEKGMGDRQ